MKTPCIRNNTIPVLVLSLLLFMACRREPAYVDSYVIEKDGAYGLIDSTGNEIVAPRFLYVEPIQKDGVALAIIDTIHTSIKDSTIIGMRDIPSIIVKYGYITAEDKFIFPEPSYAKLRIDAYLGSEDAYSKFQQEASFYGGLAIAQDTTTLQYGYIGLDGDTIIPAKYRSATRFNEGRAAVQLGNVKGMRGRGKWGLINPEGNNVCDFVFSQIETPVNKRAIAILTTVNKQEKLDIDTEVGVNEDGYSYIDDSKATGLDVDDGPMVAFSVFLIDENGKIINDNLNGMYRYSKFSKEGIAVAIPTEIAEIFGAGYRFISKDGEFINTLDENDITKEQAEKIVGRGKFLGLLPKDMEFADATRFAEGYSAVDLGGAWTYIDAQLIPRGKEENPMYEDALPFSYGLAGIKLNGKYGYINKDFEVVIPCRYDSCAIAGKNLCRVYSGRKTDKGHSITSYIDRTGKIVWQNVNYEGDYRNNYSPKTNHAVKDFIYIYEGKNYWPLFIVLMVFTAEIIVLKLLSPEHDKKKTNFHGEIEHRACHLLPYKRESGTTLTIDKRIGDILDL